MPFWSLTPFAAGASNTFKYLWWTFCAMESWRPVQLQSDSCTFDRKISLPTSISSSRLIWDDVPWFCSHNSDTNHWSTDKNLLPKSSTCSYSAIQRWSWAKHPAISSATDVSVASISQDCFEFNTFLVYRCTGWRMKILKMNSLPCMIVCLIIKSCWRNHREGTSWTQNSWFPRSSSQCVWPLTWASYATSYLGFLPITLLRVLCHALGQKGNLKLQWMCEVTAFLSSPQAEDLIGAKGKNPLTFSSSGACLKFFRACKFLCQKSPIQTKHF